jgi:hypothetical protein
MQLLTALGRQYDEVGAFSLWRCAQLKVYIGSVMETGHSSFQQVRSLIVFHGFSWFSNICKILSKLEFVYLWFYGSSRTSQL